MKLLMGNNYFVDFREDVFDEDDVLIEAAPKFMKMAVHLKTFAIVRRSSWENIMKPLQQHPHTCFLMMLSVI